jgi:hypothetical protein
MLSCAGCCHGVPASSTVTVAVVQAGRLGESKRQDSFLSVAHSFHQYINYCCYRMQLAAHRPQQAVCAVNTVQQLLAALQRGWCTHVLQPGQHIS